MKFKTLLIVLTLAALSGCSSSEEMRKRFSNNQTRIMTDELGRKYTVKHHIADTYIVMPYTPESIE